MKNKATMTVVVSKRSSQGSDWRFRAGIGSECKVKILAALKANVGYNDKKRRIANHAVGSMDMYYEGEKVGGVAHYKQFNTANPSNDLYVAKAVKATVYDKDVLSIHYEKNS
ncbi:MAG: hypothetical protein EOM28_03865 [Clostridia bacterium]|nr:hypothetical protein [Clostridia bacterium]